MYCTYMYEKKLSVPVLGRFEGATVSAEIRGTFDDRPVKRGVVIRTPDGNLDDLTQHAARRR
jgi:hypothetical protein